MKRLFTISILILLTLVSLAEIQRGIVKTRGRMGSDGKEIPGRPLAGVVIQPRGRQAVVSGADGSFSFPVTSTSFSFLSIDKSGYVLTDADVISRQYKVSTRNPVIIVMDEAAVFAADCLEAKRSIRRSLEQEIARREEEIEALRESNRISQEEYTSRLEALYADRAKNELLIAEMAQRYAATDYDSIDATRREINRLIISGQLDKADSIISGLGEMDRRIDELLRQQEAVESKQRRLATALGYSNYVRDDIAADLMSRHEIFMLRSMPDSALMCLELRASLDTLNPAWAYDYGKLMAIYQRDTNSADSILLEAARLAANDGNVHLEASALVSLAELRNCLSDHASALAYSKRAVRLREDADASDPLLSDCFATIAETYMALDSCKDARENGLRALELSTDDGQRLHILSLLARASLIGGDTIAASEYASRAKSFPEISPMHTAEALASLAFTENALGQLDTAMRHIDMAIDLYTDLFGERHTRIARCRLLKGVIETKKKEYRSAIVSRRKALNIYLDFFDEEDPRLVNIYSVVAESYINAGMGSEAVAYAEKALNTYCHLNESSDYNRLARLQALLARAYIAAGDTDSALATFDNAISTLKPHRYHDRQLRILCHIGKGDAYHVLGKLREAYSCYQDAERVYVEAYGENHQATREFRETKLRPLKREVNSDWINRFKGH